MNLGGASRVLCPLLSYIYIYRVYIRIYLAIFACILGQWLRFCVVKQVHWAPVYESMVPIHCWQCIQWTCGSMTRCLFVYMFFSGGFSVTLIDFPSRNYPKSLQKAWSSGAPNLFRRCPRELLSTSPRFSHGTWVRQESIKCCFVGEDDLSWTFASFFKCRVFVLMHTYIYIYVCVCVLTVYINISLSSEYKYIRCIIIYIYIY